uniref:Maturase K n=1 Tax=Parascaris univalens TaxID=6257 RepID=A0A915B7G9_PARUN
MFAWIGDHLRAFISSLSHYIPEGFSWSRYIFRHFWLSHHDDSLEKHLGLTCRHRNVLFKAHSSDISCLLSHDLRSALLWKNIFNFL